MHRKTWLGVALLGTAFAGCAGKSDGASNRASAGSSGDTATPVGGSTGVGVNAPIAGAGAGGTQLPGEHIGGEGCVDGFQSLQVLTASNVQDIDEAHADGSRAVAWPDQPRVAVALDHSIALYDVSNAKDGTVTLVQVLTTTELGVSSDAWVGDLNIDGQGLLVNMGDRLVSWQPDTGAKVVLEVPAGTTYDIELVDRNHGVVASDGDTLYFVPKTSGGAMAWNPNPLGSVPNRSVRPLGFETDTLLVGIDEVPRAIYSLGQGGDSAVGAGGAGGEGGPSDDPRAAHVQRWSLTGEVLDSWRAVGNPRAAAIAFKGAWTIAETNSHWGSFGAAVECVGCSPSPGLFTITHVPVIGAGDAEDGAMGVAQLGSQLFVANCESGLGRVDYDADGGHFVPVRGPWQPSGYSHCTPRSLAVAGDVLVTVGSRIDFARACATSSP